MINKNKQVLGLMLIGMTCWTSAGAMDIRPVAKLGADFGGDTLVTVTFTDGSSETVKAHEGLSMGAGVSFLNEAKSFEVEATIAYKFNMVNATNGDVTWSRFPLDVVAFYRVSRARIGGGLTYHMSPDLTPEWQWSCWQY